MSNFSENFVKGFMDKCAEHNVDPDLLLRAAGEVKEAQGLLSPDTLKQVVGVGKDPNKPSVHKDVPAMRKQRGLPQDKATAQAKGLKKNITDKRVASAE